MLHTGGWTLQRDPTNGDVYNMCTYTLYIYSYIHTWRSSAPIKLQTKQHQAVAFHFSSTYHIKAITMGFKRRDWFSLAFLCRHLAAAPGSPLRRPHSLRLGGRNERLSFSRYQIGWDFHYVYKQTTKMFHLGIVGFVLPGFLMVQIELSNDYGLFTWQTHEFYDQIQMSLQDEGR